MTGLMDKGTNFRSTPRGRRYLISSRPSQPAIRSFSVIDEFPYLVDAAPSLPSVIQKYWDHDWPKSGVKLVLGGSYVSAMKRLQAADQPLYGRRTAKLLFDLSPIVKQDSLRQAIHLAIA